MAYNDLKEFRGKVYTGMPVGGTHVWEYPHGVWQERKVATEKGLSLWPRIARGGA